VVTEQSGWPATTKTKQQQQQQHYEMPHLPFRPLRSPAAVHHINSDVTPVISRSTQQ